MAVTTRPLILLTPPHPYPSSFPSPHGLRRPSDVHPDKTIHDTLKRVYNRPNIAFQRIRLQPLNGKVSPMIGRTLGHYHITEKVGAGGMGGVYRAENSNLHLSTAQPIVRGGISGER